MPTKPKLGRVSIIGLGQIGGSIAKRLTESGAAVVTGYDTNPAVIRRARRMQIAARVVSDLESALSHADLVILAMPVSRIITMLAGSHMGFDPRSLVMDVGSTKVEIMDAAQSRNEPLRFIGGHPLAGTEGIGLDAVNSRLFEGAPFVLVPGANAKPDDEKTALLLVGALGARPLWMNAPDHDRITGLTIGLPHVIAYLMRNLYDREARLDERVQTLAGGSIWSTMRVSKSDPIMVRDFIATNREWIRHWWEELIDDKNEPASEKHGGAQSI